MTQQPICLISQKKLIFVFRLGPHLSRLVTAWALKVQLSTKHFQHRNEHVRTPKPWRPGRPSTSWRPEDGPVTDNCWYGTDETHDCHPVFLLEVHPELTKS